MAKFYGEIGYAEMVENAPGVWVEQIVPRNYYGEEVYNARRLQSANQVNDDITISNKISIISDSYDDLNYHKMRYAEFMGAKWKIVSVEVKRPRLILTLGNIYAGGDRV